MALPEIEAELARVEPHHTTHPYSPESASGEDPAAAAQLHLLEPDSLRPAHLSADDVEPLHSGGSRTDQTLVSVEDEALAVF
jgi:hypothetical protein